MPRPVRILRALALPLCAAGLFVCLAAFMRWVEGAPPAALLADAGGGGGGARPRPVAEVAEAVRTMKLVTVQVESSVSVTAKDESWRGDVEATIRVPVRLFYGTDLSTARVEAMPLATLVKDDGSPGGAGAGAARVRYIVRVAAPKRVATEVFGEIEESTVNAGWMRFKAMAGQYYLGLARKMAGDEARRMVLKDEDQQMVIDETRARVEALARLFGGPGSEVTVVFDE
jgi:hypothetical protein